MYSNRFLVVLCVLFVGSMENTTGKVNDAFLENNVSSTLEKTNSLNISSRLGKNHEPKGEEFSEFPNDLFTEEQRRRGAVILHLIGALYSFGIVGIVCGDFFLPSIDCICSDLNLSQDVAAATFMSFATTAPELFIILIATFITKSDIGIGAVVGSGMFNILGVATIGGLAAVSAIKLDWWPLYRDSLVYLVTPIALAIIVSDGSVTLIESICLIAYYFLYFVIMYFNRDIRKKVKNCVKKIKREDDEVNKPDSRDRSTQKIPTINLTVSDRKNQDEEQSTALKTSTSPVRDDDDVDDNKSFKSFFMNYEDSISLRRISACSMGSNRSSRSRRKSEKSLQDRKFSFQTGSSQLQIGGNLHYVIQAFNESLEEGKSTEADKPLNGSRPECPHSNDKFHPHFFTFPTGTIWDKITWMILWPATFVLYYTIPDCRSEKWRRYYPVSFLMCVIWIGGSSYFGTWMISVIGETIAIPDSVMGLTFLALGGSMPEAISTFIMARQGEGGIGFSNSLGGNTMDISLCLGIPWLIKCLTDGEVSIQSDGIQYNTIALLIGIFVLLSVATYTKFHMNKRMGVICCVFYLIFIVMSTLVELEIIPLHIHGS